MTWQIAQQSIRDSISSDNFSLWIRPLKCLRFEDNAVELAGPDRYFCSWVEQNFASEIKTAVAATGKSEAKIIFSVSEEEPASLPAPNSQSAEQLRLPSFPKVASSYRSLNPRYIFDEFVVGDCNAIAHTACQALAHGDTSLGNCLFINAGTGLGKTHLTHAVAHHMVNFAPSMRLNYLTAKQMTGELVRSLKSNAMESFKEKFRGSDILLMEDVQSLTGKVKTQEELAVLFDILLETGKTVIFTGSQAPREIDGLEAGLRSRLSSGLVATISAPEFETRVAIIRKKAEANGLALPDDAMLYMAEQLKGDVRTINSAIIGLKAKAHLSGGMPDLAMTKAVLAEIIDQFQPLTPEMIRDFIAEQFQVSVADLQSKSRKKQITFPRQISMFLSRKLTEQALSDIGKAFNRDHSTVVHSIRKISEGMARNSSIRGQVELLTEKLHKI